MERVWSKLMKWIVQLRYCTKQHRQYALDLKLSHENDVARKNAGVQNLLSNKSFEILNLCTPSWDKITSVKSLETKLKITQATQVENTGTLECFNVILGLNTEYFAEQWGRQKKLQIEFIEDDNHEAVQELLERLGNLEDDLGAAMLVRICHVWPTFFYKNGSVPIMCPCFWIYPSHSSAKQTHLKTKQHNSVVEVSELHRLGREINHLQEEISISVGELGDERFRDISGASGGTTVAPFWWF